MTDTKTILYFSWGENSKNDMFEGLQNLGYQVTIVEAVVVDYLINQELTDKLSDILDEKEYDLIITFDYFPFISNLAQKRGVRYASWIYDCPNTTLNSVTVTNECNHIFVFDKLQLEALVRKGVKNAFYLPLAVNTTRITNLLSDSLTKSFSNKDNNESGLKDYPEDIAFVGSLYDDNIYSKIKWHSEYLQGYMEGLVNVQRHIYGCNIVESSLTDKIMEEINQSISISEEPTCPISKREFIIDAILHKVTSDERIIMLNMLSSVYKLGLYTNSNYDLCPKAIKRGIVDYFREMPIVFNRSKINLNISLRSIQSGIPLRCMDIMGCGGFLLSNYQPELAELFVPGEEFVYYESEYDLLGKVEYYLKHDDERQDIAQRGYEKVKRKFSYEMQLGKLLHSCLN